MTEKIRVSLIGAGWFAARNHIPALAARPDVRLDGVCRLGARELEQVRDAFGFAFAAEDYRAVLDRRPDAVIVSSPHHLHYEHAKAALERGAHVLCEKPMTLEPDEAWDLVEIARASNRHLLIANSYNFMPHVDDIRRRLAAGVIGSIEHVMSSFVSVTRDVFAGTEGLRSWRTAMFRPDPSTWQDAERGGGFAFGQLSHSLALVYFLTGTAPVRASSFATGQDGVDLTDSAAIRLDTGATVSVSGAAAMPYGHRPLMRLFLTGTKGVMTIEFDRDLCEIRTGEGQVERLPVGKDEWVVESAGPVNALVELARGRGHNLATGVVGARTTATIAAMRASARADGAPVDVLGRPGEPA